MKPINKHAGAILVLVFLLLLSSFYFSSKLRFSYDFESFFPDNDPALPFFKQYRQSFGHDNEFLLLAIENKSGIFKKDFLQKIDSFGTRIKSLPFIERLISPCNLKKTSIQGFASIQRPLLHFQDSALYKEDSIYIYQSDQWKNNFFAANGQSLCLYVETREGLSKRKSDSLAAGIEEICHQMHFDSVHKAGRIFAQNIFLKKLQTQFFGFILISVFLVCLLLWFSFRKIQAVLLPLSLICISIFLTFGIMGAMNKSIDIMTAMIPTMIFVAGMSDVIHFYTKFLDELKSGRGLQDTLHIIFKEVAQPTFLTLLSTIAGFLSLCYSGMKPIRDFGIYTSVGIILAFILTYTYLPAMLSLMKIREQKVSSQKSSLDTGSHNLFFWVIRHGKPILWLTSLLILISTWGLLKIIPDQKLLDDLSDKEIVKQDFLFFEKNYGGVRPLEIDLRIKSPDKTIYSPEIMRQLVALDSFIQITFKPGFLISPVSLFKSVNEGYTDRFEMPRDTADYAQDVTFMQQNRKEKIFSHIIREEGKHCHLSAKIKDFGSRQMAAYNTALAQFIKTQTDTSSLQITVTGTANLIDLNNTFLVQTTLQGLGTGILTLVILTLIIHRSLKMVLIFLIPNLVPLLIMAGLMGIFHIPLKASTAIFFSIAFGIATDDTIHFLSRFKLELKKNHSALQAFKQTYAETGKPVFLTTLMLLGGFVSLILSDFESIRLFGLLTCLTLFIALLAEIILLPVLLMLLYSKKSPKKKNGV